MQNKKRPSIFIDSLPNAFWFCFTRVQRGTKKSNGNQSIIPALPKVFLYARDRWGLNIEFLPPERLLPAGFRLICARLCGSMSGKSAAIA